MGALGCRRPDFSVLPLLPTSPYRELSTRLWVAGWHVMYMQVDGREGDGQSGGTHKPETGVCFGGSGNMPTCKGGTEDSVGGLGEGERVGPKLAVCTGGCRWKGARATARGGSMHKPETGEGIACRWCCT